MHRSGIFFPVIRPFGRHGCANQTSEWKDGLCRPGFILPVPAGQASKKQEAIYEAIKDYQAGYQP
jgi:hypothetical protein